MAKIIDGKKISAHLREKIADSARKLKSECGIVPGLAVIIVGSDPASAIYVRNKARACQDVGFYSEVHALPEETTQEDLLSLIGSLGKNDSIHGILVQLPLPSHLDEKAVIAAIPPEKDVDAFSEINAGRILLGHEGFSPCTPSGIIAMLEYEGITIDGKECVIIGRSNIVGKPMAMLLLRANGTVTVCHSHTKDIGSITKRADILVSAVGKSHFVTADMVKDGAVVIDVGINRGSDGKLTGDVDFEPVSKIVSAITPVPGGVGPMTITMLLRNTLTAAEYAKKTVDN